MDNFIKGLLFIIVVISVSIFVFYSVGSLIDYIFNYQLNHFGRLISGGLAIMFIVMVYGLITGIYLLGKEF